MELKSKIFIAGHRGLVGSAIVRNLESKGFHNLLLCTHDKLDLTRQTEVENFFEKEKPKYVFLAAAKVGGIMANSKSPAEFFYLNSMIQNNVIHNAYKNEVKKLLFLGSTCIYPKSCKQPIKENCLLSGYLEETNEAYAIAKISGLEMCKYYKMQYGANFISCMPTNLYGPNDNFDLNNSHVFPALIRKFHEAKRSKAAFVELWGTGEPMREFLHVDDMAEACVFLMNHYNGYEHINIGTGEEVPIKDLALMIKKIVGYEGELRFDCTKPDGTLRKVCDLDKLHNLGWKSSIGLEDGIKSTYKWYLENIER